MKLSSIFLAVGISILTFVPAFAFDCDTLVVDETGNLSQPVDKEIDRMRSLGIEPRVRLIKTHSPHPSLDLYEREFVKACPDQLQTPDGFKKGNLITLIIEIEHRQIGLYYGANYHGALDSEWIKIKDRVIIPNLRSGKFYEAVSEGLTRVTDTIHAYENPPPVVVAVPEPPKVEVVPEKPPVVVEEPRVEVDESRTSLARYFIIALVGLAILVLLFWVLPVLRQRRERARKSYDAMMSSRVQCLQSIAGGEPHKNINELFASATARLRMLNEHCLAEDILPILPRFNEIVKHREALLAEWGKFETLRFQVSRFDIATHSSLAKGYDELAPKLQAHASKLLAHDKDLQSIQFLVRNAPAAIEEAQKALKIADDLMAGLQSEGYHFTDAMDMYRSAAAELAKAVKLVSEKRFVAMRKHLDETMRIANETAETAKRLPQERERLTVAIASLEDAAKGIDLLREEAHKAYERMKAGFATSSWSIVDQNGSEADRHIVEAKAALSALPDLISMKEQKWSEAEKARAFAQKSFDESQRLLEAILHQEKSIKASKEQAPRELKAARADIDGARDYLNQHDDDTDDDLFGDLDRADVILAEAEVESKKKKPDFLMVVKKALEANAAADKVFAQAKGQKEEMDRKRRLAKTSVSEAEDAIISAENYLRLHWNEVRRDDASLDEARSELQRAKRSQDLDTIIKAAARAYKLADALLTIARNAVAAAESERQRRRDEERRRREEAEEEERRRRRRREEEERRRDDSHGGYSSGSHSSPDSSGSGWGGGGSSSFGSFGNGGGGSSSW